MIIIGLTGPSGAGKSILSALFEEYNTPVLDTDKVSRIVSEPGKPCLCELVAEFGDGILNEDGTLNRKSLAKAVFQSDEHEIRLEKLNRITHRHILDYVDKWIQKLEKENCPAAVVDAPQLFESGYNKKCDYIVAVISDKEIRIRRIMERDKIDRIAAQCRVDSQRDDEFFYQNCSLVLRNDGNTEDFQKSSAIYIQKLSRGIIPD